MIKPTLPDGPTPLLLESEKLPNFNPIRLQSPGNRLCRCGGRVSVGRIKGSARGRCGTCGRYFDFFGRNMGDLRSEALINGLNMADKRRFSWIPAWMKLFPEAVVWKLADTGIFSGSFMQIFEALSQSVEDTSSDLIIEGTPRKKTAKFRQSCWAFPLEQTPGFICGVLFYMNDGRTLRIHVKGRSGSEGAGTSAKERPYCAFRYCPEGFQISLLAWEEMYETCFDDLSGFSLDREVLLHLKGLRPRIVNFQAQDTAKP